MIMIMITLYLW